MNDKIPTKSSASVLKTMAQKRRSALTASDGRTWLDVDLTNDDIDDAAFKRWQSVGQDLISAMALEDRDLTLEILASLWVYPSLETLKSGLADALIATMEDLSTSEDPAAVDKWLEIEVPRDTAIKSAWRASGLKLASTLMERGDDRMAAVFARVKENK